ncbi:alanyl-tRNA editing protein [Halostagnicola kamekurae]|uniref:Alanyl-tRNA synthetase n=1 Tax=Halostagnicola kamekurae TaxID=619731 RepID=A0A1I6QBY7_9EURY|nr:alanyl-tRNA editing protein [Halostagnicola kamekurae]SFS49993.1 alanyl-tRNA synthetase [Halostagnicola kamekurae]
MSGQQAAAEPYTTRFETEVSAVDGRRVWLETSYFYAESGGQPADRGRIGDVEVEDVQLVDGEHVHVLAEEPPFSADRRVLCRIDWSFRMYCMRAHTASHALYGAGRDLLDELGYGGFDIGPEKVRVDLETTTEVDDAVLVELNERLNRVVWESRSVSWEDVPVADAREREDVAFNEATEEGAFTKGRVRLVTIGEKDENGHNGVVSRNPWDVAACGGTHVRNTREIGPVTVLGRSNPGEGMTRVEFAVGPNAIDRRATEKETAFAAKSELGVGLADVTDELERREAEREELANALRTRERELVEARLERGETVENDGAKWLLADVADVSAGIVSDVLEDRRSEFGEIVVATGETDSVFAVVATDGATAATAVLEEITAEFGGGGGGSDWLAQGGGFDAAPAEILVSLE